MAIWYNLWLFGIVCGRLLYFFPIWNVWTKKNLATLDSICGISERTNKKRFHQFRAIAVSMESSDFQLPFPPFFSRRLGKRETMTKFFN
jgi:hypothetical protein